MKQRIQVMQECPHTTNAEELLSKCQQACQNGQAKDGLYDSYHQNHSGSLSRQILSVQILCSERKSEKIVKRHKFRATRLPKRFAFRPTLLPLLFRSYRNSLYRPDYYKCNPEKIKIYHY